MRIAITLVMAVLGGPGVVQVMQGRRRAALLLFAPFLAAMLAMGFTIYGLLALYALIAATVIDAFVHIARKGTSEPQRIPALIAWVTVVVVAAGARAFVAEAYKIPSSSMSPTLAIGDHIFISKLGTPARGDVVVFRQPCSGHDFVKRVIALGGETVEVRCGVVYVGGKPLAHELLGAAASYDEYNEMDRTWHPREVSHYRETNDGHSYEIFDARDRPAHPAISSKDFPQELLRTCRTSEQLGGNERMDPQQPGKLVDHAAPGEGCAPYRHFVVPDGHLFVMGDNRDNANDSRFWGAVPVSNVHGKVTGIWLPFGRFGSID